MWNNNMFLFGGYSDKGTSDEIWSLSAKETLRRALVGTEKVESTSELELLRKKIKELETMQREISNGEIKQYEPKDIEV
jgi:hypothetical protein